MERNKPSIGIKMMDVSAYTAPPAPAFCSRTPTEIHKKLDEFVAGQVRAKKTLSVAMSNHIKRIQNPHLKMDKSNIILIGPTGSGKTYMLQQLSKYLDLPLVLVDATTMSGRGYVGNDVEYSLTELFMKSNKDLNKTEKGIIYIDEFDKIACKKTADGIDVAGEMVQRSLLRMLEGADVLVPVTHNRDAAKVTVSTNNILFILGGSFAALEESLVAKDTAGQIGFIDNAAKRKSRNELRQTITPELLTKSGFLPELIGRCPIITYLDNLTEKDVLEIISKKNSCALEQYSNLLKLYKTDLNFTESALRVVVRYILKQNTGARGIKSIFEKILEPYMYDSKPGYVTITAPYVRKVLNV
jgi:ATP-dependent Clp protease ATP-binding subunit ClpX